jgi:hypothetical protein
MSHWAVRRPDHRGERFRSETTHSRCNKGGTGISKIGKALGVGTGTVQRVLMEQPRPFDGGATA